MGAFRHGLVLSCCLLAASAPARAEGLLGAAPKSAEAAPAANASPPPEPGSPTAIVRPFYERAGAETAPSARSLFVDPARGVLDKNEALETSGQGDCLDPNMALDNVPYDKAAVDGSLKMAEAVSGDEAKVVVAFTQDGDQHRLEWKLRKVGGEWKIHDLLSVTGEWALSQYQCD